MNPNVYLASDHRGYYNKSKVVEFLKYKGYNPIDMGPFSYNVHDDYPDYAVKVAEKVRSDKGSHGILACGSGIGMYMMANKFHGIRAAEITSSEEGKVDRQHHDSNILILDENTLDSDFYKDIIADWLYTGFMAGRHARRVKKMALYEREVNSPHNVTPKVVPAILGYETEYYANMANVLSSFTDRVGIDIMDGEFVPTKSPNVLEVLEALEDIDAYQAVHLMINEPSTVLSDIAEFEKVLQVYVHVETIDVETLDIDLPYELILTVNPNTELEKYREYFKKVSSVQIMTIEPGEQGKPFLPETLETIEKLKVFDFNGFIHIDGGVNVDTLETIMHNEIEVLNVGSAILKADDPEMAYKLLVNKVKELQK